MKKLYILFLLNLLFFTGHAQGPWDFTTTADGWSASGATATHTGVTNDPLVLSFTDTQANPKLIHATAGVDATTKFICAITLKNNSDNTVLRVSHVQGDGTGRTFVNVDITANDSGFTTYYFDMTSATNWGGTEDDIQIHVRAVGNTNNASNGNVEFDKIEFLASIPTTLKETYNFSTNGDTEGFSATNGSISGPTGGVLTFTPTADKFAKLDQILHHVNATSSKHIHVTLKNNSALNNQLRLISTGLVSTLTQEISVSDGTEKTYSFNLTGEAGWTGDQIFTLGIGSLADGKSKDNGTAEFSSIIIDNTLSVNDYNKVDFAMYPNPANNTVYLKSVQAISKVTIFDITGKQVLKTSKLTNNSLNVSPLRSGLYLLLVEDSSQNKGIQKLIVN